MRSTTMNVESASSSGHHGVGGTSNNNNTSGGGGGISHVTFRVRCETLGYGEEVYIVKVNSPDDHHPSPYIDDTSPNAMKVALYTTSSQYPWYQTTSPITLPLPQSSSTISGSQMTPTASSSSSPSRAASTTTISTPNKGAGCSIGSGVTGGGGSANNNNNNTPASASMIAAAVANSNNNNTVSGSSSKFHNNKLWYRYAIYRAGIFHRWEQPSDAGPYHYCGGSSRSAGNTNDNNAMDVDSPTTGGAVVDDVPMMMMYGGDDPYDSSAHSNFMADHITTTAAGSSHHTQHNLLMHQVPLHLMSNNEIYVVNDVLGITTGPPDIDHIRIPMLHQGGGTAAAVTALATTTTTTSSAQQQKGRKQDDASSSSSKKLIPGIGTASSKTAAATAMSTSTATGQQQQQQKKKKTDKHVGFTPSREPHYHLRIPTTLSGGGSGSSTGTTTTTPGSAASNNGTSSNNGANTNTTTTSGGNKQPVHLNSTDGLVVVSAFLPVIMQRSPEGQWTADWDYEMLLSMQTHLRVTRVGIVKWWRIWNQVLQQQQQQSSSGIGTGSQRRNDGGYVPSPDDSEKQRSGSSSSSSISLLPRNERKNIEECLRPMNCVPVWIEPVLFNEMYNGFCKGVLWPVLHNVTSVYSSKPDDNQTNKKNNDGSGDDDTSDVVSPGGGGSSVDTGGSSSNAMMIDNDNERPMITDNDAMMNAAAQQFSEYSMDDVEQGPIHGGRGREAALWSSYNTVNRQFAEVVVQCFHEGDLVWIHGFHLLILPSYLTRRIPMSKVGIFLHTPFPSSEIFRTLWCREDLLRGMLNADQVGFHLFEYARHFLTSCRRLLGLNYGMIPDSSGGHTLAIDTNGRNVVVTSIHAGVEQPVLKQVLAHKTTQDKAAHFRQRYPNKVIFCGIDRLESLKGIPLKLLGLERFLLKCPEWVDKLVLMQVGISAYERGDDYIKTKREVLKLVNKINTRWPNVIQFQECNESDMPLQQRMALLRAADIVVVTAIRDGLNLLPLEFTIAHQDACLIDLHSTTSGAGGAGIVGSTQSATTTTTAGGVNTAGMIPSFSKTTNHHDDMNYLISNRRRRGICILSEFSSSTRVMRGALHINPWKISENANAFYQALHMTEDERIKRVSIAAEFVTRVTTQRWALAVMLDLKGVNKNVNPIQYSGAGLGLGYRLLGMNTGFKSLDTDVVAKAYKTAKSRLILVDYGGTIVSNGNLNNLTRFKMVKEKSAPFTLSDRMIHTLTELCADKRNTVFVVSGKERHSLIKSLGGITNLGLAAEHGMFIAWPSNKPASKSRWETLVPETDRTWRSLATTIMEVYTSRTHGSYIEETEMKVLWQYRDADTEFGSFQAKELEDHLSKYLRSFSVDILHGGMEEGGYVEVRPKGVNKGVLSMRVLRRLPEMKTNINLDLVDFALVLGDDHSDEPMLSVMRQIGRRIVGARRLIRGDDPLPDMPATIQPIDVSSCENSVSVDLNVFTCTVGKKPSAAANYLHDVDEVQELLSSLVKISSRERQSHSSNDLRLTTTGITASDFVDRLSLQQQQGIDLSEMFANTATTMATMMAMDDGDSSSIGTSVSSGLGNIPKSMSLDQLKRQTSGGGGGSGFMGSRISAPPAVSTNLTDFLSTIQDDDEDDGGGAFFF